MTMVLEYACDIAEDLEMAFQVLHIYPSGSQLLRFSTVSRHSTCRDSSRKLLKPLIMKAFFFPTVLFSLLQIALSSPLASSVPQSSPFSTIATRQDPNAAGFCVTCKVTCETAIAICAAACVVPADPGCILCVIIEADGVEELCADCLVECWLATGTPVV